jgi:hypothetical protein
MRQGPMCCISRELSRGPDIAQSVQNLATSKVCTHDVKGGDKLDDGGEVDGRVDLDGRKGGKGRVDESDYVLAVLGRIGIAICKLRSSKINRTLG